LGASPNGGDVIKDFSLPASLRRSKIASEFEDANTRTLAAAQALVEEYNYRTADDPRREALLTAIFNTLKRKSGDDAETQPKK
jgi:hypothetical protein